MTLAKIEHINSLVNQDEFQCHNQLKAIANSNYAEEAKNLISAYFRERSKMNQDILSENGFYQEKNVGTPKNETPC